MKYNIEFEGKAIAVFVSDDILNKGDRPSMKIVIKWDGCADIRRYWQLQGNIVDPENDYLHICNIKEFVKDLQEIIKTCEENEFGIEG